MKVFYHCHRQCYALLLLLTLAFVLASVVLWDTTLFGKSQFALQSWIRVTHLFFAADVTGRCPDPGSMGTDTEISKRTTVAVIGAAGYIGTRLHQHLNSHGLSAIGFDRDPRDPSLDIRHEASYDIADTTLRSFDAVVFLGGLTGRKACNDK